MIMKESELIMTNERKRLKAINRINSLIGHKVDEALLIEDDNDRGLRLVKLENERLTEIKKIML